MPENVTCFGTLQLIVRIGQWIIPATQRNALNLESLLLQSQNFPPDEAMAYFRILIYEVCNLQGFQSFSTGTMPIVSQ